MSLLVYKDIVLSEWQGNKYSQYYIREGSSDNNYAKISFNSEIDITSYHCYFGGILCTLYYEYEKESYKKEFLNIQDKMNYIDNFIYKQRLLVFL